MMGRTEKYLNNLVTFFVIGIISHSGQRPCSGWGIPSSSRLRFR